MASWLAAGAEKAGFDVPVSPVLNQILLRLSDDERTAALQSRVQESGNAWFGTTWWQGKLALRISFSSWRITWKDAERLLETLVIGRSELEGGD